MFTIRKEIKKGDYLYALVPDHPNATKNGYVLMHRVIMKNHLGRLLGKDEVVHHKDHNKFNNSVDNLEVMDKNAHLALHASERYSFGIWLTCPNCGRVFLRSRYRYNPKSARHFCSRHCNGTFYSKNR